MPVRVQSACRFGAGLAVFIIACGSCSSSDGSGPATQTGLSVAPPAVSLGQGFDRQLVATASYSDGSSLTKTAQAAWTSTAGGVATVTAGLVSGVSIGTAEIVASLGGFAGTSEITVTSAVPTQTGVVVTPAAVTIAVAATTPLVAKATYDDASTTTVTGTATWTSTAPGVATVTAGVPAPTLTYKLGTTVITSPYTFPVGTNTVTVTAPARHGSCAVNPSDAKGAFVYTPNTGYVGSDSCDLTIADIDGLNGLDIIACNWGLNSPYEASAEHPVQVYYGELGGMGLGDVGQVLGDGC